MSLIKNVSSSFYSVLATHLIELDSSSTISSPTCHSARRACPELQNPHFKKRRKTFTHGESCQSGRMRGDGKCSSPALTLRLRGDPLLPEGEGYLLEHGFCDFAFGFAQNDRVGSILRRVKVLGIEKPTIERNQTYQSKRDLVLCV